MVKYANLNSVMKSLDLPVTVHFLEKILVFLSLHLLNLPWVFALTSSRLIKNVLARLTYKLMSNWFARARPNDEVLPQKPDKIIFPLKLTAFGQCTSIN